METKNGIVMDWFQQLKKSHRVFKKSNGSENVTAKKPEIALAVNVVVHPSPKVGASISLHWSFVASIPATIVGRKN